MFRFRWTACLSALILASATTALWGSPPKEAPIANDHAEKMSLGLDIFKKQVRPVLVEHCLNCHGGKKTEGELDISDRDRLLKGGNGGPALQPGDAKKSLLFRMVNHEKSPFMPHEAKKLSENVIRDIAAWIDNGAPYDVPLIKREDATAWTRKVLDPSARLHWAYQPLRSATPPMVKDAAWAKTPTDRFILAELERRNLSPNPQAARHQLLRRAYFDLIGLPPTPEEATAFFRDFDAAPQTAWEKLIETLLDSPHYGERWARHWLDLARFAESHGFEHDTDRPTAFHYRDFVIQAFNQDLPYDTFVKWQLAGDEIAPANPLALTATGFLAAGVHSTQITKNEVEKHRYDELDDMLATTGTAMLGLTVGCARCHDHKFDAIPSRDYYRMLATFTTTVRAEIPWPLGSKDPKGLKALISSEGLPAVRLHTQGGDFLSDTHFLKRGDPAQKESVADSGYLQALSFADDKTWAISPPMDSKLSYRRSGFANWITDVDKGAGRLLARVMVNRLWQHHMGRGIVATPSDFGVRGEKPSHPELLDYLALELIHNGWKLKPIHKLIMSSAVYQQSSAIDEAKAESGQGQRVLLASPKPSPRSGSYSGFSSRHQRYARHEDVWSRHAR